jgi:solute carrier family 35 (UDP-sugar transporter), member A1/2/3
MGRAGTAIALAATLAVFISLSGIVVQLAVLPGDQSQPAPPATNGTSDAATEGSGCRPSGRFPFSRFSVLTMIEAVKLVASAIMLVVMYHRSKNHPGEHEGSAARVRRRSLSPVPETLGDQTGAVSQLARVLPAPAVRELRGLWKFAFASEQDGQAGGAESRHLVQIHAPEDAHMDEVDPEGLPLEQKEEGGPFLSPVAVATEVRWPFWKRSLRFAVPALFYATANNLGMFVLLHMSAVDVALLSNLKIVVTALLFRAIMKKRLTEYQWLSLVMLLVGVAATKAPMPKCDAQSQCATETIGIMALVAVLLISALADVVVEKVFKGGMADSIHAQNMQLYIYGIIFNQLGHLLFAPAGSTHFFAGWSFITFCIVLVHSTTGLLVGAVLKLADNVVKIFADAFAVLLIIVLSIPIFGKQPTFLTIVGATGIVCAMTLFQLERNRAATDAGRNIAAET